MIDVALIARKASIWAPFRHQWRGLVQICHSDGTSFSQIAKGHGLRLHEAYIQRLNLPLNKIFIRSKMCLINKMRIPIAVLSLFGLIACTTNPNPGELVFDPYEQQNRKVHAFNKTVDRIAVKPAAGAYTAVTPKVFRVLVSNGVRNLAQPSYAVNYVLQGEFGDAARTLGRFGINTLMGFGGIGDPATDLGVDERPTNFGETLQVWGLPDGAYLEVPLLGASSERALTGRIVDFAINPVNALFSRPESDYFLAARGLKLLDDRQRFAPVINALLYESSDSYAALRLSYLQNKRYLLEGETPFEDLEDPYAE